MTALLLTAFINAALAAGRIGLRGKLQKKLSQPQEYQLTALSGQQEPQLGPYNKRLSPRC